MLKLSLSKALITEALIFSKEKIDAFMLDKRKKNLTIEGRAKYCATAGDFIDIVANHWALGPKNKDEMKLLLMSRVSQHSM